MKFSHLFVVGFNKTGTNAIHQLFLKSGYNSVHWDEGKIVERMLLNLGSSRRILRGYDRRFEVFSDLTLRRSASWIEGNQFFCQMAKDYPEAGFLYNYRDMGEWLASRSMHPGKFHKQSLMDFHLDSLGFQSPQAVREHWKVSRLNLENRLADYFSGDLARLATLSIDSPTFLGELGKFIGVHLKPEYWRKENVSGRRSAN